MTKSKESTLSKAKGKQAEQAEQADPLVWDEIITLHGHRIRCLAKGLELIQSDVASELPKPPVYRFKDVAGIEIERQHTAETIEDPKTTDVEREAWAAYQQALADYTALRNELVGRRIITQGIEILDIPPEEAWIPEYEWLGYKIPDGRLPRLYWWAQQELIKTPDDMMQIIRGIVKAAGADEEVLGRLEDYFRASMAQARRSITVRDTAAAGG